MKKIISIILVFLSIAILAGANIVQHFAARKLGMVRWLNYHGQRLEDSLPLDLLFYLGLVLVIAITTFALRRLWANRSLIGISSVAGAAYTVAVVAFFAISIIAITRDATPAYFLIRIMLGLSALLQIASLLIWPLPNLQHPELAAEESQ